MKLQIFNYHPPPPPPSRKNKKKRDVTTGQLRKFKEKNKIKENQQALLEKKTRILNQLSWIIYSRLCIEQKVLKSWKGGVANIKMTKNIFNLMFPIFIAIFCFNAYNSNSKLLLPWALHTQPLPQPKKLSVALDIITTISKHWLTQHYVNQFSW